MDSGSCQVGFFIYSTLMSFKRQLVELQVCFSIKDAFFRRLAVLACNLRLKMDENPT